MIIAVTRVKSIEGTTMTLESSVTVFENDDLVSFDKESNRLSHNGDWQSESMKFHEDLCQKIFAKTSKSEG
jgi:hypothetical protein